ncbi:hypothetical protein VTP01DRAFT_9483 [Rhizomucor pusillus]|uniref:uncharacterized protein n=1 Tax=Rhizomucor pusillus TaxID=4840 RepID=UPI0037425B90
MQSLAEPLYLSWQHSSPFWMTSLIQKERNSTFLQQPAGTQHRHDPETRNCPASTLAHTLIYTRIMSAEVPAHEKKTQGNKLPQLHALEEDDEFEEFAVEDWEEKDQQGDDSHYWEDNWDDDDVEDAFFNQLRQELEKEKTPTSEPMKS